MKVLFVSSGNKKYGISPIIKAQGESLKNNGVALDYYPIIGMGALGYLKNIKRLKKKLQKNHYDIIHAHYGYCGLISFFAKKKEKLIISFMGNDLNGDINEAGNVTYFSIIGTVLHRILAPIIYDSIIVKSKRLKDKIPYRKVSIISNGVDFSNFFPMDKYLAKKWLNLPSDYKFVLFVGHPESYEKNFKLAIDAVELVGDPAVHLKTVYNIPQKILNYYYNAAELLLLTSVFEGSPNSVKEAMACNCPVVSTDVGDVKEVVGRTTGCYVTGFEAIQIADCIKRILKLRKKTSGREKIVHLDINKTALKIIDLYERTLG